MISPYLLGLWIATALSVSNVVTDVLRKKALEPNDLYNTSFWLRLVATFVFGVVFAVHVAHTGLPVLQPTGRIFGVGGEAWSSSVKFAIYLLVDISLVGAAQLLYMRALQVTDLSYFLPFVSLTPVMLIPTGFFLVGELPLPHQVVGVLLIVAGSLAMNADRLSLGLRAILAAPFEKKASRYALLIALLFAFSNPVDKIVVQMSDPITYGFGYSLALSAFFGCLMVSRRRTAAMPRLETYKWIAIGGMMDALTLLLQFTAYRYLNVILVIAIKRSGVILSVLAGWLIFREKKIADRLFATAIMAGGILLIYLPVSRLQDILIATAGLLGFVFKVVWQRRKSADAGKDKIS